MSTSTVGPTSPETTGDHAPRRFFFPAHERSRRRVRLRANGARYLDESPSTPESPASGLAHEVVLVMAHHAHERGTVLIAVHDRPHHTGDGLVPVESDHGARDEMEGAGSTDAGHHRLDLPPPLGPAERPEQELTVLGEELGIGGIVTEVEEVPVVDEELADLFEVLETPQAGFVARFGLCHGSSGWIRRTLQGDGVCPVPQRVTNPPSAWTTVPVT